MSNDRPPPGWPTHPQQANPNVQPAQPYNAPGAPLTPEEAQQQWYAQQQWAQQQQHAQQWSQQQQEYARQQQWAQQQPYAQQQQYAPAPAPASASALDDYDDDYGPKNPPRNPLADDPSFPFEVKVEGRDGKPDDVSRAMDVVAEAKGLGAFRFQYKLSSEARFKYLFSGPGLMAITAGLAVILTLDRGLPSDITSFSPEWFPCALFPLGLFVAIKLLLVRNIRLRLHRRGFVFRRGGATQATRWKDVVSLQSWIYEIVGGKSSGTYGWVKVTTREGSVIRFTPDLEDVSTVRDKIAEASAGPILRAAIEKMHRGEPVAFGAITLRTDGLAHGGTVVAWNQLERLGTWDGKLEVFARGNKRPVVKLKTKHVVNLAAMIALAEELRVHPGEDDADDDDSDDD